MVAKAEAEAARLLTEAREEIDAEPGPRPRPGWPSRPRRPRRPPASCASRPTSRSPPTWRRPATRPRSCWPRPARSAGPWSTRPRASGPGCWPTCPSGGRCCTPRSSSCGPGGSVWPRRSRTSAVPSTPSPRSCSPPRTTPAWPPRPPAGRPLERDRMTARPRSWPPQLLAEEAEDGRRGRARVPAEPTERVRIDRWRRWSDVTGGGRRSTGPEVGRRRPAPMPPEVAEVRRCPLRQDPGGAGGVRRRARGRPSPVDGTRSPPASVPSRRRRRRDLTGTRHASGRWRRGAGRGHGRRRRPRTRTATGRPRSRNPLAVRRDELIDPIVTTLARRLKRTLQDSQNELLDSLRSNGSQWSTDLLPDETEHVDGYATAALPALEQAAAAGVSFAGIRVRRRPRDRRAGGHRPRAGRGGGRPAAAPAGRRGGPGRRRGVGGGRARRLGLPGVEGRADRAAGRRPRGGGLLGRHHRRGRRRRSPDWSGWPSPARGTLPAPTARTTASTEPRTPGRSSPPGTGIHRPTPGVDACWRVSAT